MVPYNGDKTYKSDETYIQKQTKQPVLPHCTLKDCSFLPSSNSFASHPIMPCPYPPNAPQPVHNPATKIAAALDIEAQQPRRLATNLNTPAFAALFNLAFGDGSGGPVLPNITVDSRTGQGSSGVGGGGQRIITDSFGHAATSQNGIGHRNTKATDLFAEALGLYIYWNIEEGLAGEGPEGEEADKVEPQDVPAKAEAVCWDI
jgi:hypothetical protein